METTLREGDISFTFHGTAVKFDETKFYRNQFLKRTSGKGMDFIAVSSGQVLLMEVKDCREDEINNLWRISPNNRLLGIAPDEYRRRDSLDIEVAKKVLFTIPCLYGGWTRIQERISGGYLNELNQEEQAYRKIWEAMQSKTLYPQISNLWVILFLEGSFGSDSPNGGVMSRQNSQIMKSLKADIKQKLSWLHCEVDVVNSRTYKRSSGYTVELHPHTV